jgi:hypothetical protein
MISRIDLFVLVALFLFSFHCLGQASWIQVADYGGGPCSFVAGGVINGKGYVPFDNEMWEYDPVVDQWNQKANFPGSPRVGAASFVIDDILHYGTGNILFGALLRDWWKYDPLYDSCTQLNNGLNQLKINTPSHARGMLFIRINSARTTGYAQKFMLW